MDAALRADYQACLTLARHYENFPVASRLLPGALRPHLAAVYAFARGADDLADEPAPSLGNRPIAPTPAARCQALEAWAEGLDGKPPPGSEFLFRALAHTRQRFGLGDRWLRDLLEAFRWDAEGRTYADWGELRAYANRSAAPIGRLVLGVAEVREEGVAQLSDDLCVALQYTNFWQDLSVDWPRRRFYLPDSAWRHAGLEPQTLRTRFLGRPLAPAELTPAERDGLEQLLCAAWQETDALYRRSQELPGLAGNSLALYLRAVWQGGATILQRTQAIGLAAFQRRPRLHLWDRLHIAARAAGWRWGLR